VQIHDHWRIEAPRNRFSWSTFRLKLGRKAARGAFNSVERLSSVFI